MRMIYRFQIEGGEEFGIEIDGVGILHNGVKSVHDVYTDRTIARQARTIMMTSVVGGGMGCKTVELTEIEPRVAFRAGNQSEKRELGLILKDRKEKHQFLRTITDQEKEHQEVDQERDKIL